MADVRMLDTADGGEMSVKNGDVEMSNGLFEAVYLSVLGGNEQDSGRDADANNWWGNLGEPVAARRYRSETQYLLRRMPAIPANLARLREAAERDLAWLTESGLATLVSARVTMPALNRVKIEVNIVIDGANNPFVLTTAWGVAA